MPHRPLEIAAFLDQQGWGGASMQAFDGDFSPRRYARLTKPDGSSAILMDADADQKTPAFVAVAGLLRKAGINAPEIYAAWPERGLVLSQDFGTNNVGALLDAGQEARPYFLAAAGMLASLHRHFNPADNPGADLPAYNTTLFTTQVELFLDSYFPYVKNRNATAEEREDFRAAWQAVLRPLEALPQSLLLRDFMPDNLMSLSSLPPAGRVREGGVPQEQSPTLGVLDFQDAGIGPVAYDLASLCEEVRRDGGFALLPDVIAHYREQSASLLSQAELLRACTILSAQRHTRILGIVASLAAKTGRRDKLAFVPRIRQHLAGILDEPCLRPVQEWMTDFESIAE